MKKTFAILLLLTIITSGVLYSGFQTSTESVAVRFSRLSTTSPDSPGAYQVGFTTGSFVDESGYTIDVELYYPATEGGTDTNPSQDNAPYPVVIFGRGFNSDPSQYEWYAEWQASWGYIVAVIDFSDGLFSTNHERNAQDISDCIDWVINRNADTSYFLAGMFDVSKFAAVGYSMGARAILLATNRDSRISTFIAMAPANKTNMFPGQPDPDMYDEVAGIDVPGMIQKGTLDDVARNDPDYVYGTLSDVSKIFIGIVGANHYQYMDENSGMGDNSPTISLEEHHRLACKYAIAHLQYFLVGDVSFHKYLFGEELDADVNAGIVEARTHEGIDQTPPTITIESPTDGSIVDGIVTISFSAQDESGVSEIKTYIDDVLVSESNTYHWDSTGWSDGTHFIRCEAIDTLGNQGSEEISVTVDNIDDSLPVVTISQPTDGATVKDVVEIIFSAEDDKGVDSYCIKIDGISVSAETHYLWDTETYEDGYHTILCEAIDTSGNLGSSSISVVVDNSYIDTTPPEVEILSPVDGATVSGNANIDFSATDDVGVTSYRILIDGIEVSTDSSFTWDTTSYTDGDHIITCEAADAAGNVGSAEITVQVLNAVENELENGVPVGGSLSSGSSEVWFIVIDQDCVSMRVQLSSGWFTDFDIYGKMGSEPTTSNYDFKASTWGGEDITIENPSTGVMYIMVHSYWGSGSYELTVTLTYQTTGSNILLDFSIFDIIRKQIE
ncbi:MAG: hypothetical protein BAJATHORv1_10602 [Candidatus Thorarchaeota archaeon]|nr:MAG: hypothetical protein BAJATHORv1_10602 [Candidatus Thorarchaeota archaeon]